MIRVLPLLALLSCATRLENRVLRLENAALTAENAEYRTRMPPAADWVARPTMADVARLLTRAGYRHDWEPGDPAIKVPFAGLNTEFVVRVQLFPEAGVLFLATQDYFRLAEANGTDSLTVLLVQLATLNYDMLLGKFQLDPETGNILLSTEIVVQDGLSYRTLQRVFEQLVHTADARYPDLERAAAGGGL